MLYRRFRTLRADLLQYNPIGIDLPGCPIPCGGIPGGNLIMDPGGGMPPSPPNPER